MQEISSLDNNYTNYICFNTHTKYIVKLTERKDEMEILNLNSPNYDDNRKNQALIQTFDSLAMGDKFIVKSDSNLNLQYNQLDEQRMNVFEWENLKEAPDEWAAVVSKRYYNYI